MYKSLGTVTLKDREQVEAGVVIGPDPAWADRVGVQPWPFRTKRKSN